MKKQLIEFYLDYVNNYLCHVTMAEHQGMTPEQCLQLIGFGRVFNTESVEQSKLLQPKKHKGPR